jgi:hypothetical protein
MRTRPSHHHIRHRYRIRPVVVAVAACSVLIAACGSNSSSTGGASGQGVNNPSNPNTAQLERQIRAFTNCMRGHGVAGLATPTPSALKGELAPGSPHSQAFAAALPVCSHLLPFGASHETAAQTGARLAAALAFARCIRSHGFPSFPDPTTTGQITHEMLAAAGINVKQPAIVQSADACAGVTHGFITKAKIARFVAGD